MDKWDWGRRKQSFRLRQLRIVKENRFCIMEQFIIKIIKLKHYPIIFRNLSQEAERITPSQGYTEPWTSIISQMASREAKM